MRTTSSPTTRSIPIVPSRMAVPPPVRMDVRHGDTVVGWIDGLTIGFLGFGDEAEAAHAALVAYRTVERRFAQPGSRRPLPIEVQPMSIARSGDAELILAAGLPIATLVRPGADSRSGPAHFGFELEFPMPADELTLRSTAYRAFHTLRRSGIRWSLWTPAKPRTVPAAEAARTTAAPEPAAPATRTDDSVGDPRPDGVPSLAGIAATFAVVLAAVLLPAITTSTVVILLGGAAALFALGAVGGLVHVVAADVRGEFRDRLRQRGRSARRRLRRAASHRATALSSASLGRHLAAYHATRRVP